MPRVHTVPTGTMPSMYSPKRAEPARVLPPRYALGRSSTRAPMHSLVSYFATYGVNASPFRMGTTAGERRILSTRNISKFIRA
jgi:hypothetical protein